MRGRQRGIEAWQRRLPILAVALLAGCTTMATGTPSASGTPSQPAPPGSLQISEAELGDDWPFLIGSGTLRCHDNSDDRPSVTFTFEAEPGVEYALNDAALEAGYPDLDEIVMPAYPDRAALDPLIERGLELCGA